MTNSSAKLSREALEKLAIGRLKAIDLIGKGGLALTSPAFRDGEELDPSFTADEEDAVAPPLEWTKPPVNTQELVIIAEDPQGPGGDPFCHWLVWGIKPQQGMLLEGEVPPRVGKNAFGNSEWLLPAPPEGDEAHNFVFQLFAVDLPLVLMPGIDREALIDGIAGHVLGTALLTGSYKRRDGDEDDWDEEFDED